MLSEVLTYLLVIRLTEAFWTFKIWKIQEEMVRHCGTVLLLVMCFINNGLLKEMINKYWWNQLWKVRQGNVKQILENGRNKGMKRGISVMQNIFDLKSSHLNMNIWWKLHLVRCQCQGRLVGLFVELKSGWQCNSKSTRTWSGKHCAFIVLSQLLEYASQFYCSFW